MIKEIFDYHSVDVSCLPQGIYYLTIDGNNIHTAKKFVISYK
jgi:hypothetical protein